MGAAERGAQVDTGEDVGKLDAGERRHKGGLRAREAGRRLVRRGAQRVAGRRVGGPCLAHAANGAPASRRSAEAFAHGGGCDGRFYARSAVHLFGQRQDCSFCVCLRIRNSRLLTLPTRVTAACGL